MGGLGSASAAQTHFDTLRWPSLPIHSGAPNRQNRFKVDVAFVASVSVSIMNRFVKDSGQVLGVECGASWQRISESMQAVNNFQNIVHAMKK